MEEILIQLSICEKEKIKYFVHHYIHCTQVLHAKSLGGISLDSTAHCIVPDVYSPVILSCLCILGTVGAIR